MIRPRRASSAGPNIHRNHIFEIRCSHPACMKVLVSNGHQLVGSSPTRSANAGLVNLTGTSARCTKSALWVRGGKLHIQTNTSVLMTMSPITTMGRAARGAVSMNGNKPRTSLDYQLSICHPGPPHSEIYDANLTRQTVAECRHSSSAPQT